MGKSPLPAHSLPLWICEVPFTRKSKSQVGSFQSVRMMWCCISQSKNQIISIIRSQFLALDRHRMIEVEVISKCFSRCRIHPIRNCRVCSSPLLLLVLKGSLFLRDIKGTFSDMDSTVVNLILSPTVDCNIHDGQ